MNLNNFSSTCLKYTREIFCEIYPIIRESKKFLLYLILFSFVINFVINFLKKKQDINLILLVLHKFKLFR